MAATQTLTLTSSGSWTCPDGVSAVKVECWAPGGAGGANSATAAQGSGGGGGGGAYARRDAFAVVPGTSYSYVIGTGGTAVASDAGNPGSGPTYWVSNDANGCGAERGLGGGRGTATGWGTHGDGGLAANSFGDQCYNGGDGFGDTQTINTVGAGGGEAAGSDANGATATGQAGGTGGSNGAAGGAGGAAHTVGDPGTGVGAGGGGGGHKSSTTNRSGGAGYRGEILLTWTSPETRLLFTGVGTL